jgi:hypothetical protein
VNINDIKKAFDYTKVVGCNSRAWDHYQSIQVLNLGMYASEGTFKCTKFPSSGHRRKNNKISNSLPLGTTILPFDIKHDVNVFLGFQSS